MAFARVYSGTLKAQGTIRNSTKVVASFFVILEKIM